MDFFTISFVVNMHDVEMCSFSLLTSMELILTPHSSLLCMHSEQLEKCVLGNETIAIYTQQTIGKCFNPSILTDIL